MKRLFYFNITFKCNNKCKECCSHSTREQSETLVTPYDIKICNDLHHFSHDDYFIINGGEPAMSPHFNSIVNTIFDFSHHIIVYSNGTLLYGISKELINKIERIIIPLYGTALFHNSYVGNNSAFADTVKSIRHIYDSVQNRDIVELKLIISDPLEINRLINASIFQEVCYTRYISIARMIRNQIPYDKNINSAAEATIFRLLDEGKRIKFYDFKFCEFSPQFQDFIISHYDNKLNLFFDEVRYCSTNGQSFIIKYDNDPNYYTKCKYCPTKHFCVQIMRNYYSPVIEDGMVRIEVE